MLLGVDVGGTFTDAVLVGEDGTIHTAKVPSTPEEQSRGVLDAVAAVLDRAGASPEQVGRFAHGMTVATNALIEGRGARTALIATAGFTDVVELARQARPDLYRLCEPGPRPLAPVNLRLGAPERMTPEGPLRALTPEGAQAVVEELAGMAPEAVAVALLHSYAHPDHELLLGELIARRLPGVHVSLSHELVGTFREYERAATTEVDAALSPLVGSYLRRLSGASSALGLPPPQIMQSSGGLIDAPSAASHAALTVLSGPAGGVAAARLLAQAASADRIEGRERSGRGADVLCFDMGGTSCDVCLIEDGQVAETAERVVAGRPLSLPMLDIHTVGAGGGSIAWCDGGGALRVGPASAGASPGPACYGQGGSSATVTDANLLLGRLLADAPLADGRALDRDAAHRAVSALAGELGLDTLRCAEGIVAVAEAEMLRALRVMTVQRGIDPRGFALMPFGGAGPLHACALAERLSIGRIICPRASGVLCALGLAGAAPRRDVSKTVLLAGRALDGERLAGERRALIDRAVERLGSGAAQGDGPISLTADAGHTVGRSPSPPRPARTRVRYELRYRGQSFELLVDEDKLIFNKDKIDPGALRERFAAVHAERYGYADESAAVELVTIRVSVWGESPRLRLAGAAAGEVRPRRWRVFLDRQPTDADVYRGELPPGTQIAGPAICALPETTLLIATGWNGEVDEAGTIHLRREGGGT